MALIGRVLGDGQEAAGLRIRRSRRCRLLYRLRCRLHHAFENRIAVEQSILGYDIRRVHPLKVGAALDELGRSFRPGGVVLFAGDGVAAVVHVGRVHDSADCLVVLDGKLLEAQAVIGKLDRALGIVGLISGKNDVVIEHVDPHVVGRIVKSIRAVGHDVREGFLLGDIHLDRCGGVKVRTHFPGTDVGVASRPLNGCGQEFQASVVVQIRNGIGPLGAVALRLFKRIEVIEKVLNLGVHRFVGGLHRSRENGLRIGCRGGLRVVCFRKCSRAQ